MRVFQRLICKTSRHLCLINSPIQHRSIWNWKIGWLFRPPKRKNVKAFEAYWLKIIVAAFSCHFVYVIGYQVLYRGVPLSFDSGTYYWKNRRDQYKAEQEAYVEVIEKQMSKASEGIEPGPALPQWPPPFKKE